MYGYELWLKIKEEATGTNTERARQNTETVQHTFWQIPWL